MSKGKPKPSQQTRQAEFGPWLRARRRETGIGIREMSKLTGTTRGYLSKIERGSSFGIPSRKVLAAIGKVLGYSEEAMCRIAGRVPECLEMKIEKVKEEFFSDADA